MLNVAMLDVGNNLFMLSVVMLSGVAPPTVLVLTKQVTKFLRRKILFGSVITIVIRHDFKLTFKSVGPHL